MCRYGRRDSWADRRSSTVPATTAISVPKVAAESPGGMTSSALAAGENTAKRTESAAVARRIRLMWSFLSYDYIEFEVN
jgi:hypothetical protein